MIRNAFGEISLEFLQLGPLPKVSFSFHGDRHSDGENTVPKKLIMFFVHLFIHLFIVLVCLSVCFQDKVS